MGMYTHRNATRTPDPATALRHFLTTIVRRPSPFYLPFPSTTDSILFDLKLEYHKVQDLAGICFGMC